jgi:hypothetical protein
MNLDQLKRDVGCRRRRLVPPACHLDSAGDALPAWDEEWTIKAVTDEYIEIEADSGHLYRLGKDHIRNCTTDIQRSGDGRKLGFLVLHVQLFVQGAEVRAVPNHQPGAAVAPPVNRAVRARAFSRRSWSASSAGKHRFSIASCRIIPSPQWENQPVQAIHGFP